MDLDRTDLKSTEIQMQTTVNLVTRAFQRAMAAWSSQTENLLHCEKLVFLVEGFRLGKISPQTCNEQALSAALSQLTQAGS